MAHTRRGVWGERGGVGGPMETKTELNRAAKPPEGRGPPHPQDGPSAAGAGPGARCGGTSRRTCHLPPPRSAPSVASRARPSRPKQGRLCPTPGTLCPVLVQPGGTPGRKRLAVSSRGGSSVRDTADSCARPAERARPGVLPRRARRRGPIGSCRGDGRTRRITWGWKHRVSRQQHEAKAATAGSESGGASVARCPPEPRRTVF